MAKKLERMEKQKSQLEQRIARQHGRAPQLLQEEQKGDGQQMMMVNNSFSSFATAFSQLNTSNMLNSSNTASASQVNTTADFGGPNVIGNQEDFADRDAIVASNVLSDSTNTFMS